MKSNFGRIVACVVALIILVSCLSACSSVEIESSGESSSMFVQVEQTGSWRIVYHRETKVMYAVSFGTYNGGDFTVLVNPDGSPMIYKGN